MKNNQIAMKRPVLIIVILLVTFLKGNLYAVDGNPPEFMTYQGYLVDENGIPLGNSVPTNYDVVFRIYKVKKDGASIWAEQQTVTVDKGYFSIILGEGTQLQEKSLSSVFEGEDISDRFIGITVMGTGGAVEIAPRLSLIHI